jgi:hypothetical protein
MIITERRRLQALRILAGCPHGATVNALMANGIDPATLDRLAFLALVEEHGQTVHSNCGTIRLHVSRFSITAAGLDYLKRGEHARE